MIFASKEFFLFLPVVLVIYHALRHRSHKYRFLLAASWLFYAWLSPQYLWVILLLTVIDYVAALRIEQSDDERVRKRWLTASIVSNLGLLFAFKYTIFVYDNAAELAAWTGYPLADRTWKILLPLGISFHTFQGISYTVDVYRRQIKAVSSFLDYALFVAFFPQLAAGPIVRAAEFLPQMVAPPRVTAEQVADGIRLFVFGLAKKLLIADHLDALFVSPVFANPAAYGDAIHRWATIAWAVQIYCDFSGYTDMALGCAKWFGFELPPNFRLPYLATSITDFWRRWHLSLSTWLRDYLYFPLGGSRGGPVRTYFNLVFIFVLCGLWHGAAWNWLAYGLFNGILISLHRMFDRSATGIEWLDVVRASFVWKLLAWAATTFQFLILLIMVRMPDWEGGLLMMRSLAGVAFEPTRTLPIPAFVPTSGWGLPAVVPLLIAVGMSGHLWGLLREPRIPMPVQMVAATVAVVLIVTLGPGVAKTFIYIQF